MAETNYVQAVPLVVVGFVPGPLPATITCPSCQQLITTVTEPRSGLLTYLLVGGLALFGCVLGCCLIPLCVDSCKDVEHTCPNCKNFLGKYTKLKL